MKYLCLDRETCFHSYTCLVFRTLVRKQLGVASGQLKTNGEKEITSLKQFILGFQENYLIKDTKITNKTLQQNSDSSSEIREIIEIANHTLQPA